MSRALRRLAKRAERKPARKKQYHYAGDDLIGRRDFFNDPRAFTEDDKALQAWMARK